MSTVAPARATRVSVPAPCEVWARSVWELSAAELGWLSAAERAAADRLRRPTDRRRLLACRAFVRERIGRALGIDPAAVRLGRERCPACGGPNGRPVVTGVPELSFSYASSGEQIVLALGSRPLGVDVEEIGPALVPPGMVAQLHPRERAELEACPPAERARAFLRLWTRKEACLKAMGTGIAHGIAEPDVSIGGVAPPGWRLIDLALGDATLALGDATPVASLAIRR